jgi:hypothetical protein
LLQNKKEGNAGELEGKQTALKKIDEQLFQSKLFLQHTERDLHQNQGESSGFRKDRVSGSGSANKLEGELAEIRRRSGGKNQSELKTSSRSSLCSKRLSRRFRTERKNIMKRLTHRKSAFITIKMLSWI